MTENTPIIYQPIRIRSAKEIAEAHGLPVDEMWVRHQGKLVMACYWSNSLSRTKPFPGKERATEKMCNATIFVRLHPLDALDISDGLTDNMALCEHQFHAD